MAVLRRRCTWPQLALLAVRVISLVGGSEHPSLLDPPIVVRNGTNASVVLDCAYTLPPDDTLLHVKWFHIRSAYTLVFQWIHGQRPQALGPLRHRVNLSFTASETANERYRAMQILRPTVELSGRYMCKVTSTRHDFTRHKRLVVYTSPREMSISEVQPGDNLVNITCHVSGMYPEPRVELYRGANSRTMVPIEGLNKYVSWRDGLYDVTAFWVTRHELLQDHTLFECIMRISDTNYMERREISYSSEYALSPDPPTIVISGPSIARGGLRASNAGCQRSALLALLALCLCMVPLANQRLRADLHRYH
ncbi:uncharacterized protein LOC122367281 [Amphibalanus amphitrite]|uniref:uncharacterized protein LOC122367281 n=1 Tax=Amphibalanus amphitrite TaxID=1232801 RepID=UPI001C90FF9D|nr:uncharacterized protein LOC122367281 [Amphibalanus amphitrite]